MMVARLVADERLSDPALIRAFLEVRRHDFVPREVGPLAYDVEPLDLIDGQTITCPGFVAHMTSLLDIQPGDRVLDVGTGSGYQAAILAAAGCDVVSIEIRESLHELGAANLEEAGYDVDLRLGDGAQGAPDRAPFDAIVVACTPDEIPPALLAQLADGGVLVGPEGNFEVLQKLVRIRRRGEDFQREEIRAAWFVPMVDADSAAVSRPPASMRGT